MSIGYKILGTATSGRRIGVTSHRGRAAAPVHQSQVQMRRNVQREGPQPSLGNSITYSSKADAAYAAIRSRILNGNLVASETLNQEQLAGELGVSTTPLREALRRLESEGLVLVQPHRDVVVAPLDVDEMVSLYEVREVLDSLAAGLAAEHHDERDRNEMEAASRQLRDPRIDPVDANRTFHAAIYRASHNEVLIGLLDRLWDKSDRYRRAISGIARDSDTVQSHVDLLRTVLDGDADRAYQLMREHIRTVHEVLEDVVRTDGVESASHDLGVGA